jgi:hypothetical protein
MLPKFDFVGTTEMIPPVLRQIGALLGVELHLHERIVGSTASPKRIDRSDRAVVQALRQRTLLDEVLCRAVSENRPGLESH